MASSRLRTIFPCDRMKDFLVHITTVARQRNLPFLLVGGNAVILYGVPRFTRDIDLLITDQYRDAWQTLMLENGYQLFHRVHAFDQYEPKEKKGGSTPGVDFMLVDENVWLKLMKEARWIDAGEDHQIQVPSPLHFIAMKLTAASSPSRRQNAQDLSDVAALMKRQGLDLNHPDVYATVMKYGGSSLLEQLRKWL